MKTHNVKWLLVMLTLIYSSLFSFAMAENKAAIVASGICGAQGDNLTWTLDNEGTLTITGAGEMENYSYDTSPWSASIDSISTVSIEKGVSSIGEYAFYNCNSLSVIIIPDSVTTIGTSAFSYCTNLANIVIPDSVTTISQRTFYNCSSLTNIIIPNDIVSIEASAFSYCQSLTSIDIPDKVTSISQFTFDGCSSLKNISIPDNVTSIGRSAFKNCNNLMEISIPSSVISIDDSAFYGCSSLNNITLPNSLTAITSYTFYKCSSLSNLDIPDGVSSIGDSAFYECSGLNTITIPNSVTSIDEYAFFGCNNLTRIVIPNGVTFIGYNAFRSCSSNLICNAGSDAVTALAMQGYTFVDPSFPEFQLSQNTSTDGNLSITITKYIGNDSNVIIPSEICHIPVSTIGKQSFENCSNVHSVSVSDGITSIGLSAFHNCSSLTSVSLPNSIISIGSAAFHTCNSLVSINLPDNMTIIESSLFYNCSALEKIAIHNAITSIGNSAFYNCSNLASITIPKSVKSIGQNAFNGCESLTEIKFLNLSVPEIGKNALPSTVIILGYKGTAMESWIIENGYEFESIGTIISYGYCGSNLSWGLDSQGILTIEGIGEMNDYSSFSNPWLTNREFITTIKMKEGVASVGNYAFYSCNNLTSINIPDTITEIGDSAFAYCRNLETLIIPGNKMPTIGTNSFTSTSPTIYCHEFSDADIWAFQNGYDTVYLDTVALPLTLTLPDDRMLLVGDSVTVTPELFPAQENAEIVWTSSAPEIVSVENGVLTAHAIGEATITANCGSGSDSIVVTAYVEVDDFDLSTSELWMVGKTTVQLSVQNLQPTGAADTFTYESSNTATLTVDDNGLLTGLKPGDAKVTVTSGSGITRECLVHVCYPVTAIEFENDDMTVLTDVTMQLTASVTTSENSFINKLVTFSSSDETVAAVDENGLVTAIRSGTTTITATAASGVTASCEITVRNPNTLTLPAEVKTIEIEAFVDIDTEKVILPDGCERIGARAFANSDNLYFVYVPDSVTSIADDAFEECDNVRFICESQNSAAAYAIKHSIPYSIE